MAVLATTVGPVAAGRGVAVLDPGQGLREVPGPHVEADVGSRTQLSTVLEELVGPEPVGLDSTPGQLEPLRAAVAGPDAVGPKIVADEVAPGPTQDAQAQRAEQIQDIGAKTPTVAQRRAFLEQPTVDTTAQVLDETSENVAVKLA
jgi:hypothetical protein